MTNQEYLSTLSPEDFYAKLEWLLLYYARDYIDIRGTVIDWLKQEYKNPKKWGKCPYFEYSPHVTGTCAALMPDKDCPLYYCLKKIIEENEFDKEENLETEWR